MPMLFIVVFVFVILAVGLVIQLRAAKGRHEDGGYAEYSAPIIFPDTGHSDTSHSDGGHGGGDGGGD